MVYLSVLLLVTLQSAALADVEFSEKSIHCEVQDPEDSFGDNYWQEAFFEPGLPEFVLAHYTKTEDGVTVTKETLLGERTICGRDRPEPISTSPDCTIHRVPPSAALPGRWYLSIGCGGEASVNLTIHPTGPVSRFQCQARDTQANPPIPPLLRVVLLKNCRGVD